MRKFILLYALLVFSSYNSSGQNETHQHLIDSLVNLARQATADTVRTKLLNSVSSIFSNFNYDEGLNYARQAEDAASRAGWRRGIADANIYIALNHVGKCNYVLAVNHYLKSLKIYRELKDLKGASSVYANMGLLFLAKSDYNKALESNFKALSILEELNDIRMKAIVLENIGTVYLEQKTHKKALDYYSQALDNYKKINDRGGISRNFANQAIILNEQGDYEKALKYHLLALKTNQEAGDQNAEQINLANIGITNCYLKKYPSALEYHFKALALSRKLADSRSSAINLGNIGELYYCMAGDSSMLKHKQVNLSLAISFLDSALQACREIKFEGPYIEFSKFLSDAYVLNKDYKKALEVFKKHTSIKDTVFSQEARMNLANIETKRSIEIKNKDIVLKDRQILIEQLQVINKRNERVVFLVTIGLLFIIIILLHRLFRLRNRTHKRVLSDIANIQSHGVRAPLARILGLAQLFDQNDPAAPINKQVVNLMNESAHELDTVIRKTVDKASE